MTQVRQFPSWVEELADPADEFDLAPLGRLDLAVLRAELLELLGGREDAARVDLLGGEELGELRRVGHGWFLRGENGRGT